MFLQENLDGNILETGKFLYSHVQCKTKLQILLGFGFLKYLFHSV